MESSQESLFDQAMARYQEGASAAEVLPDFLRITEAAPVMRWLDPGLAAALRPAGRRPARPASL